MKRYFAHFLMLVVLFAASVVFAATPQLITHQGFLTTPSGDPVPTGPYQMRFRIWGDSTSIVSPPYWDSGTRTVQVTNGQFTYMLGKDVPFLEYLFVAYSDLWLGTTIGSDPEIAPRTRLTATPYALQAENADGVTDHSITNVDISNDAYISVHKINGTAATLAETQVFTGYNTFNGGVIVGDSTLKANANGVTIGTSGYPQPHILLHMERAYQTTDWRNGIVLVLDNDYGGGMRGADVVVTTRQATPSSVPVTAVESHCTSNNSWRYGLWGFGEAFTHSITTGCSYGLYATAFDGINAYGVFATASDAVNNYAVYAGGNCFVSGTLTKAGGSFRIDHPLDPENKYLQHSFVESPDMKNIYDGVVTTDADGFAQVEMPSYFDALNRDFRYQLTVIGQFAQAIVAQEMTDGRFSIRTDKPGVKVSWQVTGIRHDKWANANRIEVELDKPADQKGKYLHPTEWRQSEEKGIDWENNSRAREMRATKR